MTYRNVPKILDPLDLRRAFGAFATGVTVVTTIDEQGHVYGFTANSFTSVSLEPPLLLVNISKSAYGLSVFTSAPGFAVNILAERQRALSNQFATQGADKFTNTGWHSAETGSPILDDVVAWFDCESFQQIEAGDHVILIGRVLDYRYNSGPPLGFCRGAYVSYGLTPQMLQLVSSTGRLCVGALIDNDGRILLQTDSGSGEVRIPIADSVGDVDTPGSLIGMLAEMGIEAHLPFLYSAYHVRNTRFIYYRGEVESSEGINESAELRFFEFDKIPWSSIRDYAVKRILRRFENERLIDNFAVYIGGSDVGEIYQSDDQD